MIDAYYPTTEQLVAQKRTRSAFLLTMTLLTGLIVFGSMVALHLIFPRMELPAQLAIAMALFITVATPVMIWNKPILGLYILFGACCLLEFDGRNAPVKIFTTYIPFFLNYNNIGSLYHTSVLEPIKFCPAEQFIVLTFMSWMIRAVAKREFHFERGQFLTCILLYIACVTFGFIHGMSTGGDTLLALWEVRPQFLFLATYIVAANVITDRRQLLTLFWIAVLLLGARGFLGIQAYAQRHITIMADQGILQHEDSLLFNILFFIPIVLSFCRAPKKLIWWSLLFLPAAMFSDLENNRRAGIAAFIIAFIALLPIIWSLMPDRRKQIQRFVVASAIVSAIYLPLAWNSHATWAFPARALRSQSDPSARDQASDVYRLNEDTDLIYTRNASPWIGYGYGKPWIEIIPLPHVSGNGFLQVVAHDSVLWVWMRLGHLGFFCFIMMLANILIRGPQLCRLTKDPLLLTFSIIAILYCMMCYIYGKYDLQFVNYRSMIMLGILTGILSIVPKLAEKSASIPETKPEVDPIPKGDEVFVMPPLNLG